ncbi:DUF1152 domain-containing protein [Aureispira sp. CCB-QB1]|uniref:DUF1152 domain-containing protein n=1 Tax=Aureispira sp. CCB-QB1 TaxID=1313421 RepID=UPI000697AE18|nr:DUF1152 domain-containing protein [Aureispira sp. CCB-QB1]
MNHSLTKIPLFQALENSQHILLAGAGGGFDIYAGIPLYFALKQLGKTVTLANFSFTWLDHTTAKEVCSKCYQIEAKDIDQSGRNYFPEKFLKQWLAQQKEFPALYAFDRMGVQPLKEAYIYLQKKHQIDSVLLVDGGTDSVLFGDEELLGTPQEDMCTIAAVQESGIPTQLLASIGFGIDHFHGVSHFRFLENVAALAKEGGYLGLFQLTQEMPEAQHYMKAVHFANQQMPQAPSIVSNSIVSALQGAYGNIHATTRTIGSELWINPLMTIYWCFELNALASKIEYLEAVKDSVTMGDFNKKLAQYRSGLKQTRPYKQLPI